MEGVTSPTTMRAVPVTTKAREYDDTLGSRRTQMKTTANATAATTNAISIRGRSDQRVSAR
jgi:hypothetical protein